MANSSDAFWQNIVDAETAYRQRQTNYQTQYGEDHAYRLANAYMQYPWVNPQLLVTMVLNDADDALPQLAEYAAARMAQAGVTPRDIAAEDEFNAKIQGYVASKYMEADPDGNNMLAEYASSLQAVQD